MSLESCRGHASIIPGRTDELWRVTPAPMANPSTLSRGRSGFRLPDRHDLAPNPFPRGKGDNDWGRATYGCHGSSNRPEGPHLNFSGWTDGKSETLRQSSGQALREVSVS